MNMLGSLQEAAEAELKRRYLEAKEKGYGAVFVADIYPNELHSAGAMSTKLLDRLFDPFYSTLTEKGS